MDVPLIAVLGSDGQLGQEFINSLGNRCYPPEFDLSSGFDITDPTSLKFLTKLRPRIIVNCAAYTNVDKAEKEREKARAINADSLFGLSAVAKECEALLVHFSTDQVFNGNNNQAEVDDSVHPINYYGQTKAGGEVNIIKMGVQHLIIRTSWLFGGENHESSFVKKVLDKARKGEELFGVTDQVGCPTYTEDLVECTMALIEANQRGIFHFRNAGETSKFDFMRKIVEVAGLDAIVQPKLTSDFPPGAKRAEVSILSTKKTAELCRNRPWQAALMGCLRAKVRA